jgi:large subunit ribosomal protein L24e
MKCSFCNENIEQGTGKMFVKNDGKIFYFCSKKCEKNMLKLKREPKNVRWVSKKKAKK